MALINNIKAIQPGGFAFHRSYASIGVLNDLFIVYLTLSILFYGVL